MCYSLNLVFSRFHVNLCDPSCGISVFFGGGNYYFAKKVHIVFLMFLHFFLSLFVMLSKMNARERFY